MSTSTRPYTEAERRYWLAAAIARAKAEILGEIADGRVPATVATFSELHDYLDANELGGLCEDGTPISAIALPDDGDMAFANAVQDAVHAWLEAGRPDVA